MKKSWKYLLGVFLLTAGLLAGCSAEAMPPQEPVQTVENREEEVPDAENEEGAEVSEEQEVEAQEETEEQETEVQEILEDDTQENASEIEHQEDIQEEGAYTSKEEVAKYLSLYGHLPDNFITKKEAKALGWVSSEGNLADVAPGKSIGGDYFGNFEGNLPEKEGREYHECDIDSDGGYRGAKRIVYSNDGLIYYTEDHYETFELLYGEE